MKNALLISAAVLLVLGFFFSLIIGVSPLVLAFVTPAIVLIGLSVYYDNIVRYVLDHKQGIYLAACHSKVRILQVGGYIQDEIDVLYNNAIPEEWDRALSTVTNRYGHDVSDPNICWYDQPTNEEE